VVSIYRRPSEKISYPPAEKMPVFTSAALFVSMLLIIYLGIGSEPIMRLIETGLKTFS
jgi:type VI protein secretion system component VasF